MSEISIKELLEAGVHFGHQTKRWNPKMKKFIFGEKNSIYIIDLQKTLKRFKQARDFIWKTASEGRSVLFVATKRQAQEIIEEEAKRCGMFYVTQRWLGGMLTNFETIRKSVDKLKKLEKKQADGTYERLPKKEVASLEKKRMQLERNLGGIKQMNALPGALFVVDIKMEHIAVLEANRLGIPVVGVVDTNSDPDDVQYPVPGNDDAIRSIRLITSRMVDAILDGRQKGAFGAPVEEKPLAATPPPSEENPVSEVTDFVKEGIEK
ncbi:MAG TPA: 30S ribosomal protein S2 [Nitrospiria bacterium]|jgi:small subunit ribosomal protein S2